MAETLEEDFASLFYKTGVPSSILTDKGDIIDSEKTVRGESLTTPDLAPFSNGTLKFDRPRRKPRWTKKTA